MAIPDFYRGPAELIVDRISFNYYGGWYSGRGMLQWDPEKGFRLIGFVDRKTNPLKGYGIGRAGMIRDEDRKTVRLRFQSGEGGVIPRRTLVDRLDVLAGERLDVRFPKLHLFRESGFPFTKIVSSGEAVFSGWSGRPYMPDLVRSWKKVGTGKGLEGWSRSAMQAGDRLGLTLRGELLDTDKTLLHIGWNLKSRMARVGRVWRWPEAVGYALTFATGHKILPVESEVRTKSWSRRTVMMKPKVNPFGIIAVYETEFLDSDVVAHLAKFFVKDTRESMVARRILDQLSDAARQSTWEATELLLATILEAALRTLQNVPFTPHENSKWRADAAVAAFRAKYLDPSWRRTCRDVLEAWKRLRHRNAHPSWLSDRTRGNAHAKEALADMALLARFYGAMILAMSGWKVEPQIRGPVL